jgi:hypothetical protein
VVVEVLIEKAIAEHLMVGMELQMLSDLRVLRLLIGDKFEEIVVTTDYGMVLPLELLLIVMGQELLLEVLT